MQLYKTKDINTQLQVKDIDEAGRKVLIYVSAFGNKDSDGDVIVRGAYARTINNNMKRIKHLEMHDSYRLGGKPISMVEDERGLLVESQLANTTLGNDMLENYKLDLYEHSVGFQVVSGENMDDYYEIREIKLWEYSSVTWGANENTPLVGMKSLQGLDTKGKLEKINDRMDKLVKAIRKGTQSDEQLISFEIELKQIQSLYNSLANASSDDTQIKKQLEDQEVLNALRSITL